MHSLVNFVGSILTLDDLNSVYERVIQAAGNWLDLGLALRLGHDILGNIKDEYRDKNQTCLREMLAACLKTGTLNYSKICSGLKSSTVRQDAIAEAIKEEFRCMNSDEANSYQYLGM